jgi:hypothetical protein
VPRGMRNGHSINWKGGRSVASNGYVLIYVGKEHHLADVRGYAYEHRLVAEAKLGRRLVRGEVPHHINEIKTDNRPENIEVCASDSDHFVRHRRPGSAHVRLPGEPNPEVACGCGCGAAFPKYDSCGRLRRYVARHHPSLATKANARRGGDLGRRRVCR